MESEWRSELRKLQLNNEQRCDVNGYTSVVCNNGGGCKPPSQYSSENPCNCLDGFGGPQCQESCTLQCQNDGQCTFEESNDGEEPSSPWGQAEDGMFCSCPQGHVGLHCEFKAQTCGSDEMICLNGSTCVRDNQQSGGYRCEPPQKQPHQLARCNPSQNHAEFYEGMAVAAFCVNGGTCREVAIGNEAHPYCECGPDFTGPHCEYLLREGEKPLDGPKDPTEASPSGTNGTGMILLTVFLAGVLVLIGLFVQRQVRRIRRRRRRRMVEQVAQINLQGFRDGGEDHNEEFNASKASIFPAFPPLRQVKRKNSGERRWKAERRVPSTLKQSYGGSPSLRRKPSLRPTASRFRESSAIATDETESITNRPDFSVEKNVQRSTFGLGQGFQRSDSLRHGWDFVHGGRAMERSDSFEKHSSRLGRGVEGADSPRERGVARWDSTEYSANESLPGQGGSVQRSRSPEGEVNRWESSNLAAKESLPGLGRGVQRSISPNRGAGRSGSIQEERGGNRRTFSSNSNINDDSDGASSSKVPSVNFV